MTRMAAIVLPRVRIEIARRASQPPKGSSEGSELAEKTPLAVVIARPGGTVKDETSLLGNTRLDEVSPEARAIGIRRGMTIAAARALSASLRVRVVHVTAVCDVLASLAETALAFGPITSFEAGGALGDVVWVDVTGCAHLHDDDERTLASRLGERVRAWGHACRVAVADGPRVAAAVALHAKSASLAPLIVPAGKNVEAMSPLPLRALPLDEEAIGWLTKVGVRNVGELARLPRASLGTRLGKDAACIMSLLEGDDRARLTPHVPPEVPEERAELEYGIESTEALLFVAKGLCDRMAGRLGGRCEKAARIELVLSLDKAMMQGELAREESCPILKLALPSALGKADELFGVLRACTESYVIPAPILAVTLRATECVLAEGRPLDLFTPEARAERALPRLTAELAAELGASAVGTLELTDTWVTDQRARLVPLRLARKKSSATEASPVAARALSGAAEPSRFLPRPLVHQDPHDGTPLHLVARFEAVEWWKRGESSHEVLARWMEKEKGMAWIEFDRVTGAMLVRGWMD